jgi:hypothetical protein
MRGVVRRLGRGDIRLSGAVVNGVGEKVASGLQSVTGFGQFCRSILDPKTFSKSQARYDTDFQTRTRHWEIEWFCQRSRCRSE